MRKQPALKSSPAKHDLMKGKYGGVTIWLCLNNHFNVGMIVSMAVTSISEAGRIQFKLETLVGDYCYLFFAPQWAKCLADCVNIKVTRFNNITWDSRTTATMYDGDAEVLFTMEYCCSAGKKSEKQWRKS